MLRNLERSHQNTNRDIADLKKKLAAKTEDFVEDMGMWADEIDSRHRFIRQKEGLKEYCNAGLLSGKHLADSVGGKLDQHIEEVKQVEEKDNSKVELAVGDLKVGQHFNKPGLFSAGYAH